MVKPTVGGQLAEELHSLGEAVLQKRALLLDQRLQQPTVAEFYAGCSVLLTGASGFLGRLLVEHLLRCCPDIGNVYLVMRAKKGVKPQDRLRHLLDVALFDRLRSERPGALSKLVVLPGDVTALRLGLSPEHQELVKREVAVVMHVAASVRFDDPIKKAIFTNLRSTREVVELAKAMPLLKVLVHVSTAYTNINRNPVEERVYPPQHDWREVIRWAEELEDWQDIDKLGDKVLGFHPNSYTFTKALAEQLVADVAHEIPVIITRPSIVTPTKDDPIPGWMDNLYGLAGFWAGGFKGVIRIVHNTNVIFDSVPADVATKMIILSSWARGLGRRLRQDAAGVEVVNVTVGSMAGISFTDMAWCVSEEGVGRIVPYPGVVRPPKFSHTNCSVWFNIMFFYHHFLFGALLDLLAKAAGMRPRLLDIYRKTDAAMKATAPFQKQFQFEVENQLYLRCNMHPADEKDYCTESIRFCRDSVEVFRDLVTSNVRGILKYTLQEEDNPEKNWKSIVRLKWVMAIYHTVMAALFFGLVYSLLLARNSFQSSSKAYL